MIISEQDFLEVYAHSDRYFKVKLEMANMCSHFDSFRLFCMFSNVKKKVMKLLNNLNKRLFFKE